MHDYVLSCINGLSDTNIIYFSTKLVNFSINIYKDTHRQYKST